MEKAYKRSGSEACDRVAANRFLDEPGESNRYQATRSPRHAGLPRLGCEFCEKCWPEAMSRILRWAGLGFALGAIGGALYVFAPRIGGSSSPHPLVQGPPKPTAVDEEAIRGALVPLLPEGITLARVEPIWFQERVDGSFAAGYRLRFDSAISWFQLPVGRFEPPKGADAQQRKLAAYLVFYPDLPPGFCYRINRRRAVAAKGKTIVVRWRIDRALFSAGRWRLEKQDPLPFERWGRVFTEEEVAEVQKTERSSWEGMVRTLAGIRSGRFSSVGSRSGPAGSVENPASREQGDLAGERVAKALPIDSLPMLPPTPPTEGRGAGTESSDGTQRLYQEYERQLKAAAAKQRARLAKEKENSSASRAPSPAATP